MFNMKQLILFLLCVSPSTTTNGYELCLQSDGKKQPLVFDSEKVIYPSATCGKDRSGELFQSPRKLYTTCNGDKNPVKCKQVNKSITLRDPDNDGKDCTAYKTGFKIPASPKPYFHTVYVVCWDKTDNHPKWVRNIINPSAVDAKYKEEKLIDTAVRTKFRFSKNIFGDYNPRPYFSVIHQRKEGLVRERGDFYARGHLAPAADFFLAAEKWATFSLENAVPQWQSHNNGEWKDIEFSARHTKNAHMAETGPIFLNVTHRRYLDTEHKMIPVPDALYKVVYNKKGDVILKKQSAMVPTCKKST
uniref:Wsv191-like protein n=1 Tax=Metopaulias depressus WSSV-like virus TaxID=1675544 RepID=A0A0K0VL74_9VIRU|nr:wsv191-like protein [Metopaulias depressus WSSV-like virus]